jgi:oligopeptide/dipeptide ABC transporter ATP-binding protein
VNALYAQPCHPYTDGLLRSRPGVESVYEDLRPIPGAPPAPGEITTGCRFAPRCPHVIERCVADDVQMVSLGSGRETRCIRASELLVEAGS